MSIMCLKVVVICVCFATTPSLCADILGIVQSPLYSHQIIFQPIWKELSLRGHDVTVLTTDPINDPKLRNLTEINLNFTYDIWNEKLEKLGPTFELSATENFDVFLPLYEAITDAQLSNPRVQSFINSTLLQFDLVMVEYTFPAMSIFAEIFKCPIIALLPSEVTNVHYQMLGNPVHPRLYPEMLLEDAGDLSWSNSVESWMMFVCVNWNSYMHTYPRAQSLVEKYVGQNYPQLQDIKKNISLLFINKNPIFNQVRPLVPNLVQLGGGIHLMPPKPIPMDLQIALDRASQGFIYFNVGKNIRCTDFAEIEIFLEVFAKLPYTVLWKFECGRLPRKSKNVIISKWFPQQDVLRHPNAKLFITHGGQQSVEEAILNHIPMVGIPYSREQEIIVKKIVNMGLGVELDYATLNKELLHWAIMRIASNIMLFRPRVERIAELMKDQPQTSLERAIWWTEYVLRYNGATHLRNPAADVPLYQYFLVDSFIVPVIIVVTPFLLLFYFFCKYLYYICVYIKMYLDTTLRWDARDERTHDYIRRSIESVCSLMKLIFLSRVIYLTKKVILCPMLSCIKCIIRWTVIFPFVFNLLCRIVNIFTLSNLVLTFVVLIKISKLCVTNFKLAFVITVIVSYYCMYFDPKF